MNKRTRSMVEATQAPQTACKFSVPGLADTIEPVGPAQKMKSGGGKLVPYFTVPFQLPCLPVAFETRVQEPLSGGGRPGCKVALTVDPEDEFQKQLITFMNRVDAKAKAYIDKNPKEFFSGKKKLPADLSDVFTPSIRASGDYKPLFSAKCAFKGTPDEYELLPSCFLPDGIPLDPKQALGAKNRIVAIVRPKYLWAISGRFGITWTLERACVLELAANESAFDFDLTE